MYMCDTFRAYDWDSGKKKGENVNNTNGFNVISVITGVFASTYIVCVYVVLYVCQADHFGVFCFVNK